MSRAETQRLLQILHLALHEPHFKLRQTFVLQILLIISSALGDSQQLFGLCDFVPFKASALRTAIASSPMLRRFGTNRYNQIL